MTNSQKHTDYVLISVYPVYFRLERYIGGMTGNSAIRGEEYGGGVGKPWAQPLSTPQRHLRGQETRANSLAAGQATFNLSEKMHMWRQHTRWCCTTPCIRRRSDSWARASQRWNAVR